MTLLKTKFNGEEAQSLPKLFESFFNEELPSLFAAPFTRRNTIPPVNIKELNDSFSIEVAAPGMKKEDFKISAENNQLGIAVEGPKEQTPENEEYSRREFDFSSFCRYFTLPDSVNSENINARYENGLLRITLPKTEESKTKGPRQINIS